MGRAVARDAAWERFKDRALLECGRVTGDLTDEELEEGRERALSEIKFREYALAMIGLAQALRSGNEGFQFYWLSALQTRDDDWMKGRNPEAPEWADPANWKRPAKEPAP